MQLNLVHKFVPSFFWGAMTSWAQLALIGTTHRLTTNAWVGKTLSGRECWNKSAPNYQKGHLWISTPPPLSPGCSGVFPSDDNPFTKVPFNAEIFFVHWRWNPVKKVSIGCEDTFVRLMVLSLKMLPWMWRNFLSFEVKPSLQSVSGRCCSAFASNSWHQAAAAVHQAAAVHCRRKMWTVCSMRFILRH